MVYCEKAGSASIALCQELPDNIIRFAGTYQRQKLFSKPEAHVLESDCYRLRSYTSHW